MEELKWRIPAEGGNLGRDILKAGGFVDHQVDAHLTFEVGAELAHHFADAGLTRVSAPEISGITPALE